MRLRASKRLRVFALWCALYAGTMILLYAASEVGAARMGG